MPPGWQRSQRHSRTAQCERQRTSEILSHGQSASWHLEAERQSRQNNRRKFWMNFVRWNSWRNNNVFIYIYIDVHISIFSMVQLLHESLSPREFGDWPRRCSTTFQSSKVVFQLSDHFGSNYLQTLLMARPSHLTSLIPRFVIEPFDHLMIFYDSEAFLACISWPFRESAHHNPVLGWTHATRRQSLDTCSSDMMYTGRSQTVRIERKGI